MLTIQNLCAVYPDKTMAIDDINLYIKEGESIALVGGNGAGKTSLLLALVGVLPAQSGSIDMDDISLTSKTIDVFRRHIGLVFQNPDDQLFMPDLFDDIAFGCRNAGMDEGAVKARVEQTLDRLGIAHLRDRSSLKLSGGEKRMAAIATVLAMEPSILLFDEPTAFLDPPARKRLIEALGRLPHTKIIATHDMSFARCICERVVLLKDGRVVAEGTLDLLSDKSLIRHCGL